MSLDGFISPREIVSEVRTELSDLNAGQRVAFAHGQIDALTECADNVVRVPREMLLLAWKKLQTAYRFDFVADFLKDDAPPEMARWFLIQAADFSAEAATLFDKAGAQLVADVIVPKALVEEVARRKALNFPD